jgi:hypothetical protein
MFRYKISKPPAKPVPLGKPVAIKNDETLSGQINGQKASDIEERFARALSKDKRVDGVQFRFPVISPRSMPGMLEIDFVVTSAGLVYAFQVDGEISHKGIGKKMDDARKDVLINTFMRKYNAFPVKRISGDLLSTQEQADQIIRELIR